MTNSPLSEGKNKENEFSYFRGNGKGSDLFSDFQSRNMN